MQWFCHIGGQQYGPVEEEVINQWINEGRINSETLMWAQGMEQWQHCDQTPPFAAAFGTGGENSGGTRGETPNKNIMAKARGLLSGQWGKMALYSLGYFLTLGILSSLYYQYVYYLDGDRFVVNIRYGDFIFGGAASLGCAMLYLALIRSQNFSFATYFKGFKNFWRALVLNFLFYLFIFLWMLLLIIPGIIAAYNYAMAFYILADNPDISPLEALKKSKKMMYGHRMKLFCLGFRFIGWFILALIPTIILMNIISIDRYNANFWLIILCQLPFYIGMLWLIPYFSSSIALFYQDIQPPNAQPATQEATDTEAAEEITPQEPE